MCGLIIIALDQSGVELSINRDISKDQRNFSKSNIMSKINRKNIYAFGSLYSIIPSNIVGNVGKYNAINEDGKSSFAMTRGF